MPYVAPCGCFESFSLVTLGAPVLWTPFVGHMSSALVGLHMIVLLCKINTFSKCARLFVGSLLVELNLVQILLMRLGQFLVCDGVVLITHVVAL